MEEEFRVFVLWGAPVLCHCNSCILPPDVDECLEEPCSHGCFNNYGSFMCNCEEGFELAADGTSCIGKQKPCL